MNQFFNVKSLEAVLELTSVFDCVGQESVGVLDALDRVLSCDLASDQDMPGFRRATMDGYAVKASSTFGASESSPVWLAVQGTVNMGEAPDFKISSGGSAKISTGGMLPQGTDSVVMVEHTQKVDDTSVEIYKSVAPLQNVIDAAEDFAKDQVVLEKGFRIRPQEQGVIAGMGFDAVPVFRAPKVGIISTGDEIIPITEKSEPGKIRDINSYSLAGFVSRAHAAPVCYGIVNDDPGKLRETVETALKETDMLLISGGSSVGARDYTLDVLESLPDTKILVHGISLSPGKPTILGKSSGKPVWGLPGQVTSAMVVFQVVVRHFLDHLSGMGTMADPVTVKGSLTRNIASAQGRRDFVRVVIEKKKDEYRVVPVLGKSGLIRTMVKADGLIEIPEDLEGFEKDQSVEVMLF